MKTKHLKQYRLVCDGIMDNGEGGLWTLQHPTKEAQDYYLLKFFSYDPMLIQDTDLINELDRLGQVDALWFEVLITCTIKYDNTFHDEVMDEMRIIKTMKIEKIEIENMKEPGQP